MVNKKNDIPPPAFPLKLLKWLCKPEYHSDIEGDLLELYHRRVAESGRRTAALLLFKDVVLLLRPGIVRPPIQYNNVNNYGMYKSYATIAWRTFLKNKGYSFINISGLAVGLAACLLIGLYVQHELNYDRFNENAARIYRVNCEVKFGDNHMDLAVVSPLFGQTAKEEVGSVVQTSRLKGYGGFLVKKGDENIREENVAWADSTLFDVFTLPIIAGNPKKALTEPNSIVITESVAEKYFNRTDVVGETLTINNTQSRKITCVIKDIPSNSHFRFTSFIPLVEHPFANEDTWAGSQNWPTYLLLKESADVVALEKELNKMQDRYLGPQLKSVIGKTLEEFNRQGDFFRASLTRLTDIHLHSNRIGELSGNGNIQYVYVFSAIAICILVIAIINFMNLATARSAGRAKEVGMRKVMGSMKGALIRQFITESSLTCVIAMILAIALTIIILPSFNSLTGKSLTSAILLNPQIVIMLTILMIAVAILSGSYPAFYLSAFEPVRVLKGTRGPSAKKSGFRNVLVVFQFAASVILIAATLIVFKQMKYIQQKDLGYNREQMLIINNISEVGSRVEALKSSFLQVPGVENATVTGFLPVKFSEFNDSFFTSPSLELKDAISLQRWTVDDDYLQTMGIRLLEGRNFSKHGRADTSSIILNESAAKFLGSRDIIDKKLYRVADEQTKTLQEFRVIGIVRDFHFSSLRDPVKPLAFILGSDHGRLTLKLATSNIGEAVSEIEKQWKSVVPDLPFEYSFMDADFDNLHKGERQTGNLITWSASFSILISCLGLFGLATFMAEQRTKEIGIRKVMGASVPGITALLSKDFFKLVLISVAIATPVAYYIANEWLQGFAYRIKIEWWVFAISGVTAIVIALVTVSFQATRAAMQNPVTSLRSE